VAAPTNHWKLGLFVVVAFILAMASIVALGARSLQRKTKAFETYFDESVQGLDVGSPVKFRGVGVGDVAAIDVAPDRRHVQVTLELEVDKVKDLALIATGGPDARTVVPPDLRVQLGSSGITGVKFVSIDFFATADNPVLPLPFPVTENYIPSARSTMKNLEDSVVHAVDRFPDVAEQILALLGRVNRILDDVDDKHLPEQARLTLNNANGAIADLRGAVHGVDVGKLSTEAQKTLAAVDGTLQRTSELLDRLQAQKGVLASTERAANAVSDLARGAVGLGAQLDQTLRDVQDATLAVQRLGDELDRDPDMLLKGRSKSPR
jgi:phospholipid/cholesterol/gamma-HCH transport system substrate-binding protein